MPGCEVRRIAVERLPMGQNWLLMRAPEGWTCAYIADSIDWDETLQLAIRDAVRALPVQRAAS